MTQFNFRSFALLLCVWTRLAALASGDEPRLVYTEPVQLCTLENKKIAESSGLAVSRRTPGLFWTHNDSGDKPRLYCFDRDGKHRGTCKLKGAGAIDWEDMCSFMLAGKPKLLVGDIGDNAEVRKSCRLYLIDEPTKPSQDTKDIRIIRLRYETGPLDCEAMGVDPVSRKILFVEKKLGVTCRVLQADLPSEATESLTARLLGRLRLPLVTALDVSPDGRRAVVLTLGQAFEFVRREGEDWQAAFRRAPRTIDMPARKQGEAICYGPEGRDLFLTSEQRPTPLFLVPGQMVSERTKKSNKRAAKSVRKTLTCASRLRKMGEFQRMPHLAGSILARPAGRMRLLFGAHQTRVQLFVLRGSEMKFRSAVALLALVGFCLTSFVGAEEGKKKAEKKVDLAKILKQTKCPMSGRPVDAEKVVAYKDSKVFMCCPNCVKAFPAKVKKDTTLAAKANRQLVVTKQAHQVKCAMNPKGKIKEETLTKLAGLKVGFCCKNCQGAAKKLNEEEVLEKVFHKNFDKSFAVKAQEAKKKKAAKEAA